MAGAAPLEPLSNHLAFIITVSAFAHHPTRLARSSFLLFPFLYLFIELFNECVMLILDEPTNHLDIGSREVLLDALKRYEGTILFVSHDRFFLKELANKVMLVDKGEIYQFPGSYSEYLSSRK